MKTKLLAIIAAGILALVGTVIVIERGSVQQQQEHAAADAFKKTSTVDPNTISTTGGARY